MLVTTVTRPSLLELPCWAVVHVIMMCVCLAPTSCGKLQCDGFAMDASRGIPMGLAGNAWCVLTVTFATSVSLPGSLLARSLQRCTRRFITSKPLQFNLHHRELLLPPPDLLPHMLLKQPMEVRESCFETASR